MAEIKVTVSSTKPQKVSVSNNTIQHEVTASPDLAQYYSNISKNYSETAENWATKTDGKVDGIEYSAKHYAQKAETLGIEALQNLEIAETQAIADVNVARDNAIIELNTTGQEQINTVSEKVSEAIEGVENAGRIVEEAIEDIQNTAEKNKKELQTISNEIKENAEEIANRTSFSMFDTILKDHLLTYEESKGLALQGTYVYKEAIAGSRYGYPDFYNKCLEEFQEATEIVGRNWTRPNLSSNGSMGGDSFAVSSNRVQLSGNDVYRAFDGVTSGGNYFHTQSGTKTGYIDIYNPVPIKITGFTIYNHNGSANRASSAGIIYGSDNGSAWTQITTYTNSVQTAGGTWNISLSSNSKYYNYYRIESTAGGSDSYWTINEIKISATQQLAVKHSNGHTFYDVSQKDQIDQIFNSTGMAWMYGIDQENERIFLPRNNWFEQMTANSSEVGDSIEAGLPNITGTTTSLGAGGEANGAFSVVKSWGNGLRTGDGGSHETCYRKDFDASRSSSVYGKSNTVQPNAVKKLLYICVGNTESQSTITDVVEVTTTENDTLPLGYHFYQANSEPSVSYLKSQGQWNDGNVYATFYNEFVQKVGQAFAGGKVVNYTDDYTDYDLVLNQDDMTFRLPLLDGSEDLPSNKYDDILSNITGSSTTFIAPANGWYYAGGNATSAGGWILLHNETSDMGGSFDRNPYTNSSSRVLEYVKKGDTVRLDYGGLTVTFCRFIYAQGNGNLYFKVANAVTNLELLDAGEVLGAVADIIPNNSSLISSYGMPSGKYIDLTLGASATTYTAPANGWVYVRGKASAVNQYLVINKFLNTGKSYEACVMWSQSTATDLYVYAPVLKGEKFRVGYTMAGTSSANYFRFIYAEGEI